MAEVVIVLPGQSYGPDMPGLAIPIDVLRGRGARIVTVEYPPPPWPDWRRAEAGDWSDITDALAPQIAPARERDSAVTVIAKSMGTSVFGGIRPLLPDVSTAIWITPLFHDAGVRADVLASAWRCLSIFGTADPAHDPDGQAEVTAACGGVELAIPGADHRLVVEGDDAATRAGLEAIRRAVEAFCE